jgi:hypothetical protein
VCGNTSLLLLVVPFVMTDPSQTGLGSCERRRECNVKIDIRGIVCLWFCMVVELGLWH